MRTAYLDSSAIVKLYVEEDDTPQMRKVYERALNAETVLAFSVWNIGETLGALDKYLNRGWLGVEEHRRAKRQFLKDLVRLLRLRLVKLVPLRTGLLIKAWDLVEKHHMYQADALQIVSAKAVNALEFYTGDRKLHNAAVEEGLKSHYLT